jgi:hypothetical protein
MIIRKRDKQGRFIKETRVITNEDGDEREEEMGYSYGNESTRGWNRRNEDGLFIRIPCYEYIPFMLCLVILIVSFAPWTFIIKSILRKVFNATIRDIFSRMKNGTDDTYPF